MSATDLRICGLSAVRARFQRDAKSIQRLYFDYETGRKIGIMTKALAAARRIYRCVEPAELVKIADTVHHGGIVAVVPAPALAPIAPEAPARWAKEGESLLVLDRIGNAHNLGALARTAAFFGIPRLIVVDEPGAARPNDAAYRVAEGGLEWLTVHGVRDLPELLRGLRSAGYSVIGASPGGPAVGRFPAPPVALVLGNEEKGLAPATAAACTQLEAIRGSGRMESLNVSAAGAVLMARFLAK